MKKPCWWLTVLALALAGCHPSASGDTGFDQQWKAQYPDTNLELARAHAKDVCAAYQSGTTYRNELDFIMMTDGRPYKEARAMIIAATANYCPQYKHLR